ncbi:MAG: CoA ester lyase [Alphaproteobacteria bacterium]|nr:CoA ester lyase [Alphaproteobacteria bacterium]
MTDAAASAARPRRSVLYMPGSNPRALEKARSLPADGLILDLEDAVAPDAKAEARKLIGEAVAAGGYGKREVIVRVNGLDTAWGPEDMAALAGCGCDAVLIPKVESAAMVEEAAAAMRTHGAAAHTALWCMIETPKGVLHAEEIAAASPPGGCFVMGTSDLAKDLHAAHTRERLPMLPSLGICLLAARAHGLAILDGVHLDLQDDEGHVHSCHQGAELGFDGKTLIHPKQIAAANEAFAPTEEEVAFSRKIIAAHAEAQREGKGVVVVDGRLVENLHVENAKRLVALAEAIDELDAAAAA